MRNDEELQLIAPEPPAAPCQTPTDDEDFEKQCQRLEMRETRHKYSIRRCVSAFLLVCAGVVVSAYTLHLILPERLHWLTAAQLDKIKDVALTVFGGLAMSVGTLFYAKK